MRNYIIFTDSSADLTTEMSRELGLRTIQLDVIMEGEQPTPNDKVDIKDLSASENINEITVEQIETELEPLMKLFK